MQIALISLFPEMFTALEHGIVGRSISRGLLSLHHFNPRDFTHDSYRRVDDRPYGGGPGMVMMFEPLYQAISSAKRQLGNEKNLVIYLSPQGKRLNQRIVEQLSQQKSLILLAGRYEGIDQRLIDSQVDEEWSVGDYVVSGGELPAMLLIDAITRLLPGALGDYESAIQESFTTGLLDHPHYTRPETIHGISVPKVLLGGDHQAIKRWRFKMALGNTWQKRPDLIKRRVLTEEEQALLDEYLDSE